MIKRILCVLMCLLLMLGSIFVGTMVTAKETEISPVGEEPVYYIETYEQLRNHAGKAQSDYRYILTADIEQVDNENDIEVVIPSGACFNLDLNGFTIHRSTSGNDSALFRIRSDASMTIKDTSSANTGTCIFTEGYSTAHKAVFKNEGGVLEIINGNYEVRSYVDQGDCSVIRTTSGYTYVYDGTFDSSSSWGGDTISVGHDAYLYEVPRVVIFGGSFFGKFQSIDVTPFYNYLNYGCLFPSVFVLGGDFYVTNGGKDGDDASFAYCNNGYGRVIVADGTVFSKCLNARDQMFLSGSSKKYVTHTIDDYRGSYYEVTAPPVIMSDGLDYYYRLHNLCLKEEARSYKDFTYAQQHHGEKFEEILSSIDTMVVSSDTKEAPVFTLENRTTDHQYIRWYMVNESEYNGEDTQWTYLGDFDDVSHFKFPERPEKNASYIVRCVVTNKDLSSYEDKVRVIFEELKEPEVVSFVDVTDIEAPVAGKTPDTDASCVTQGCNVSKVEWYDATEGRGVLMAESDTFAEGRVYRVVVIVETEDNHVYLMVDGYNEATGNINGETAIVYGSHDEKVLELGYEFAPCETGPTDSTEPSTGGEDIPTDSTGSTEPSTGGEDRPTEPSTGGEDNPTDSTEPSSGGEDKPTTPDVTGLLGDANCDGKVNIKDATEIQKHIAGLVTLSETGLTLADVDNNSNVNIKDATAIQKHIAGMETGFPIGEPFP